MRFNVNVMADDALFLTLQWQLTRSGQRSQLNILKYPWNLSSQSQTSFAARTLKNFHRERRLRFDRLRLSQTATRRVYRRKKNVKFSDQSTLLFVRSALVQVSRLLLSLSWPTRLARRYFFTRGWNWFCTCMRQLKKMRGKKISSFFSISHTFFSLMDLVERRRRQVHLKQIQVNVTIPHHRVLPTVTSSSSPELAENWVIWDFSINSEIKMI